MEALDKDFLDLVASEDRVSTDDSLDDLVNQILSANADVEPTVEEETETEEEPKVSANAETEVESTVEEETDSINEEELALIFEDLQDAIVDVMSNLHEENSEINFDDLELILNEDGNLVLYSETNSLSYSLVERDDRRKRKKQRKRNLVKLKDKKDTHFIDKAGNVVRKSIEQIKKWSRSAKKAWKRARKTARTALKFHFDPSLENDDVDSQPLTNEGNMQESKYKETISKALQRKTEDAEKDVDGQKETYDPSEDVSALLTGEELSEEFKEKASTIFEAAVNNEVEKQLALAEAEVHSVFDSAVEDAKVELTEQVDKYLDYVAEQWFEDNKIAIDTGIRSEIAENFISGLKTLFTENYVEVPEEKTDILEELGKQLEETKASLNEQLNSNISLKQELAELKRHEIVQSVSSDLTVTEVEKLKELSEGITFDDTSDFVSKLEKLKESYFPTDKPVQQEEEQEESFEVLTESMDIYTSALSRSIQR